MKIFIHAWPCNSEDEDSVSNAQSRTIYPLYSDGAGRTGVFLAIDANLQLQEEDGFFDIYGYLKKLRQARRGLIENVVSCKLNLDRILVRGVR